MQLLLCFGVLIFYNVVLMCMVLVRPTLLWRYDERQDIARTLIAAKQQDCCLWWETVLEGGVSNLCRTHVFAMVVDRRWGRRALRGRLSGSVVRA